MLAHSSVADLDAVVVRRSRVSLLGLVAAALALTAAGSSGWVTFRTDGVRIRHPSGWNATARPLTPVTSPEQVLAVASFAFPKALRPNGCRPAGTLAEKQPSGAVIFVIEYGADNPNAFPQRPTRFKLRGFAYYECFGRSYQLRFREAGRYFQVFVSFGRRATSSTRAIALRILDSFGANPR
jgi:hypothetical protein